MEQQFFSCKTGHDFYGMYGSKDKTGVLKSFGVSCDGFNGGRWKVLGAAKLPSLLHSQWTGNQPVTSLAVYKMYVPSQGYYVVSGMSVCTTSIEAATKGAESCHGFALNPKCNAQSPTCNVEVTTAAPGKGLHYWFFKTILTSAELTEQPGYILEIKASVEPFTSVPV